MNSEKRPRPVALVTGGSRGIGRGIAECLARDGFDLAINGVREIEAVAETLSTLEQLGAETLYCRGDVSDKSAREEILSKVLKRFGRLNVLVNNAGIAPRERRDILEATEESFEHVIKVNLQGPYFLTQAAARWLIEQKQTDAQFRGCIINVGSISATIASISRGEYCIAKAGIGMATRLWATRLGEFDLPVYEVRPGIIKTDMTAGVVEKYDDLIAGGLCVQKRWGHPSDTGKAVAALARGDFPFSTGQVIMVDGGLSIQRL